MYEIPEGSKTAKGRTVQSLINIEQDDKIKTFVSVQNLKDEDYISSNYLIMAAKQGIVKRTLLEEYSHPCQNGISATIIKEGDELIEVKLTSGSSQLMLAVKSGRATRFNENKVRAVGHNSREIRGTDPDAKTDEVVGMIAIESPLEGTVLVVSENGCGKRLYIDDPETREAVYRVANRGGRGIKTISITDKTGQLVAIKSVIEDEDLMIIDKSGIAIRLSTDTLRIPGRATQSVKLINIKDKDSIAAVTKVMKEDDDDDDVTEEVEVSTEE